MVTSPRESRRPGSSKQEVSPKSAANDLNSLKSLKSELLRMSSSPKVPVSPNKDTFIKRKQSFEVLTEHHTAIDAQLRSLENVTRQFQNNMYKNESTTSAKEILEHEIIRARRTLSQTSEQYNAIVFDEVETETSRTIKIAIQKIDETRETISAPRHTPDSSYNDPTLSLFEEASEPSETGGFSVSEVDLEEFRQEAEENNKLLKTLADSVARLKSS